MQPIIDKKLIWWPFIPTKPELYISGTGSLLLEMLSLALEKQIKAPVEYVKYRVGDAKSRSGNVAPASEEIKSCIGDVNFKH